MRVANLRDAARLEGFVERRKPHECVKPTRVATRPEVEHFLANWKSTSSSLATCLAQVGSQLPAESKILNPA